MTILGIHSGHDASLSLVRDGKLICSIAVERYSRNKKDTFLSRAAFAAYVFENIPQSLIAGIYQPHMTQTPIINFIVVAVPSVIFSFLLGYIICKLPVLRRIF